MGFEGLRKFIMSRYKACWRPLIHLRTDVLYVDAWCVVRGLFHRRAVLDLCNSDAFKESDLFEIIASEFELIIQMVDARERVVIVFDGGISPRMKLFEQYKRRRNEKKHSKHFDSNGLKGKFCFNLCDYLKKYFEKCHFRAKAVSISTSRTNGEGEQKIQLYILEDLKTMVEGIAIYSSDSDFFVMSLNDKFFPEKRKFELFLIMSLQIEKVGPKQKMLKGCKKWAFLTQYWVVDLMVLRRHFIHELTGSDSKFTKKEIDYWLRDFNLLLLLFKSDFLSCLHLSLVHFLETYMKLYSKYLFPKKLFLTKKTHNYNKINLPNVMKMFQKLSTIKLSTGLYYRSPRENDVSLGKTKLYLKSLVWCFNYFDNICLSEKICYNLEHQRNPSVNMVLQHWNNHLEKDLENFEKELYVFEDFTEKESRNYALVKMFVCFPFYSLPKVPETYQDAFKKLHITLNINSSSEIQVSNDDDKVKREEEMSDKDPDSEELMIAEKEKVLEEVKGKKGKRGSQEEKSEDGVHSGENFAGSVFVARKLFEQVEKLNLSFNALRKDEKKWLPMDSFDPGKYCITIAPILILRKRLPLIDQNATKSVGKKIFTGELATFAVVDLTIPLEKARNIVGKNVVLSLPFPILGKVTKVYEPKKGRELVKLQKDILKEYYGIIISNEKAESIQLVRMILVRGCFRDLRTGNLHYSYSASDYPFILTPFEVLPRLKPILLTTPKFIIGDRVVCLDPSNSNHFFKTGEVVADIDDSCGKGEVKIRLDNFFQRNLDTNTRLSFVEACRRFKTPKEFLKFILGDGKMRNQKKENFSVGLKILTAQGNFEPTLIQYNPPSSFFEDLYFPRVQNKGRATRRNEISPCSTIVYEEDSVILTKKGIAWVKDYFNKECDFVKVLQKGILGVNTGKFKMVSKKMRSLYALSKVSDSSSNKRVLGKKIDKKSKKRGGIAAKCSNPFSCFSDTEKMDSSLSEKFTSIGKATFAIGSKKSPKKNSKLRNNLSRGSFEAKLKAVEKWIKSRKTVRNKNVRDCHLRKFVSHKKIDEGLFLSLIESYCKVQKDEKIAVKLKESMLFGKKEVCMTKVFHNIPLTVGDCAICTLNFSLCVIVESKTIGLYRIYLFEEGVKRFVHESFLLSRRNVEECRRRSSEGGRKKFQLFDKNIFK